MDAYYVNRNEQANGDHEVHKSTCYFIPNESNRIYLGYFSNCQEAVRAAKQYYNKCNGCYFCSNACHTS